MYDNLYNIKEKFLEKVSLGSFIKICDPAIVEIAGYAGFDFVIIDLEHGPISIESCQNMIRAAEKARITPIVRVSENNEKQILRVLDIGAYGIEAPNINTKEQAENLVKFSYYSPKGDRGVCRYVRAAQYSNLKVDEYLKTSNENIITIAHIEGKEGIKNLSKILEVQELDILFIGPYDLSQSLEIPGQIENPKVIKEMEKVTIKCKESGKSVGTFVENPLMAEKWIKAGVKYIAYSVDVGMIYDKFSSIVDTYKKILSKSDVN